jgi:hypothetical protein
MAFLVSQKWSIFCFFFGKCYINGINVVLDIIYYFLETGQFVDSNASFSLAVMQASALQVKGF